MNSQKFITGTLAGGIAYFLLGYLVYGLVLASFFGQHSVAPAGSMKAMNEIVWWALILGNIAGGALLTYIFQKIGTINSFGSGASVGAGIGFFMGLSMDLIRYGTENAFDMTAMVVDVIAGVVMTAIAGGVVGIVLGRGAKKA
jgi:hypothetical protein